MAFATVEALKSEILRRCEVAVTLAREEVFKLLEDYLTQHYAEFTPKEYDRTLQLLCSCVKDEVVSTGNGFTARVYFDASKLNYLTGSWSGEDVLSSAAHGSHGGYVHGTAIYDQPIEILNRSHMTMLKHCLIEAGIPVV